MELSVAYQSNSNGSTRIKTTVHLSLIGTKTGEVGAVATGGAGPSSDLTGGLSVGLTFHWSKRKNRVLKVQDFLGFESNYEASIPVEGASLDFGIVEGKFNLGLSMGLSPLGVPSLSFEEKYGTVHIPIFKY